ncbi:MAG: PfkB family carbohydrate kinase [Microthrixaceae bacterium]
MVFANENELLALFEIDDLDRALQELATVCPLAAVTRSEHGSVVVSGSERTVVAARPVAHVVDTTGAGDMYAAGFLFGMSRGRDHRTCAEIGSIAAAEVISTSGPGPRSSSARCCSRVRNASGSPPCKRLPARGAGPNRSAGRDLEMATGC